MSLLQDNPFCGSPFQMTTRRERCVLCGGERHYHERKQDEKPGPRSWGALIEELSRELQASSRSARPWPVELPIKLGGIFALVRAKFSLMSYWRTEIWVLITDVQVPDRKDSSRLIMINQMHQISWRFLNLYDETAVLGFCRRQLVDVLQHEVDEGLQRFDGTLFNDPHRHEIVGNVPENATTIMIEDDLTAPA